MTTTDDPFTEAARAEAERRHPAPEIETGAQLGYTQTQIREVVRRTFTGAAAWARDYIAEQEPTDAEVEAAKAVLDSVEYADEPQSIRAALSAARAARRDEEKR